MGLFRKRKEEELVEEEPKVKLKQNAKPIKDLNPENKKKRKEPKKPWGKKERILVFVVLFVTTSASGMMALSSRGWKLPGYPRLTAPKISWNKTYTFNDTPGAQEVEEINASPLVQEFRNLTNELTGVYGFYVVRLNNGASYGYNHRQVFDASTLIQLPAMVMVYRDDFDINGTYRLQSEDKTGSGPLQEEEVDTVWTYGELARYIGRENDEASYNIVLKELGEQNVQEFLRTNGISNTSLDKSTTTPKDVGTLLLKLWRREFVEQGARDELLENLKDSEFNQHLVAGVPSGVQVVHKFGEEVNAVVEAGIVYAHEPFVVVIMSEGVNMAEADEVFPELARLIWEFEGE